MSFAHPFFFVAAALAAAAMGLTWRWFDRRQRAALDEFLARRLQVELTRTVSRSRITIRRGLFAAAVLLLLVSMAGPQWGYRTEHLTRRGNDVIFAVDTSRSMLTPDMKPSRLTRAKLAIDDFVGKLDGDGVGLIAFAGTAFLQSPVTLDYGAFRESLSALDTNIIPRGGTDITNAIDEAEAAFKQRPGSDKILILVTDGEDLEGNVVEAAQQAAQQGVKIYTIGVGTQNGDLIPLPADQGGGFLKDSAGQLVKSRLDAGTLQRIASATGGTYAPLGAQGEGLDAIYRQALSPLAKHALATREERIHIDRFQWALALSLASLLASLLINSRRAASVTAGAMTASTARRRIADHPARAAATALLALLCAFTLRPAHASVAGGAQTAYAKGDFAAAAKDYQEAAKHRPDEPVLAYNAGAADYKAGDFAQAQQAFESAISASPSASDKRLVQDQDTYYDLGNTLYRAGQKTAANDAQQTLQTWTKSVKAYDAALQLRPEDADAKFNRDLVNRKIAALKQQQAQKNQQPKENSQPRAGESQSSQQKSAAGGSPAPNKASAGQQSPALGHSPQSAGAQDQAAGAHDQATPSPTNPPGQNQGEGQPGTQTPRSASQGNASQGNASQANASQANASQGGEGRVPGEMSAEEARNLLDSMSSDERHVGGQPIARATAQNRVPPEPAKDW